MDLEKILENYEEGEPIFLSEIKCCSPNYLSQEFRKYTEKGILTKLYNGVYYKTYRTILGTEGRVSIEKYFNKVYLNDGKNGYYTGLSLANQFGLTSQNPSVIEIRSNKATTKQRKKCIDGHQFIIYQPVAKITKENLSAMQFLDLMTEIDKYSKECGSELTEKLKAFIEKTHVDFKQVRKCISNYPICVYKNIYVVGLMHELV